MIARVRHALELVAAALRKLGQAPVEPAPPCTAGPR